MTKLLEKVFAEAAKLSLEEQDALAELLLAELASEQRWSQAFAGSQKQLSALAEEARNEYRQGKTTPFDEN